MNESADGLTQVRPARPGFLGEGQPGCSLGDEEDATGVPRRRGTRLSAGSCIAACIHSLAITNSLERSCSDFSCRARWMQSSAKLSKSGSGFTWFNILSFNPPYARNFQRSATYPGAVRPIKAPGVSYGQASQNRRA